jgi:hypothetical protein
LGDATTAAWDDDNSVMCHLALGERIKVPTVDCDESL